MARYVLIDVAISEHITPFLNQFSIVLGNISIGTFYPYSIRNLNPYDEIADQIFALREKHQQASMDTVQRDEQLQRITELQDFIKEQSSDLTVFDETLVKSWLKQIIIWSTHCTVEFKSKLKVDVER